VGHRMKAKRAAALQARRAGRRGNQPVSRARDWTSAFKPGGMSAGKPVMAQQQGFFDFLPFVGGNASGPSALTPQPFGNIPSGAGQFRPIVPGQIPIPAGGVITRSWQTTPGRPPTFYRIDFPGTNKRAKIVVAKTNGTIKTYTPARHIVIPRNLGKSVRSLLRADAITDKLVTSVGRRAGLTQKRKKTAAPTPASSTTTIVR